MGFKKEVLQKLNSIEIQMAINTKVIDEHHKRSTLLEERFMPIEESVKFNGKLTKTVAAIVAIVASLASAYHYLFSR